MAMTLRKLADQKAIKKNDMFRVELDQLHPDPENIREDSADLEAHIDRMVAHLESGGQLPPIIARVDDDGRIIIVDGHSRRRTYIKYRERGNPVGLLDVLQFTGNNEDRLRLMLTSPEGRKLMPMETAFGYKRYAILGFKQSEIAERVTKSRAYVEMMLVLANANTDVHQLVRDEVISASDAVKYVREHGERAGQEILAAQQVAKNQGKTRVTAAVTKGPTLPPKLMSGIVSYVDTFADRLGKSAMRKLAEIEALPEEARNGKTVEVDANVLLELVRLRKEAADARAQKVAKARERAARAGQGQLPVGDDDNELAEEEAR
ncbi:hypothetical protein E2P84_36570 [Burkholderia cepacia]|uniref:ParB-like N-terminal domain-containing protein n=1 Tax=Burkholderia cepacia TaxID=292 RepID=A0AAX2RS37_BURCE|nr:ParB N-terminal domain-containing protein [Burkholderia cepacia]TES65645.1 hypothetical protein E2P84_36570 [Burkholderia cepacia]TET01699.1 hypothetical protein E3D36_16825 [Burkholderia cepacia]TEU47557.1 hypothetical protein E3D37_16255 [Burkholderia cepacia]TEU53429.1 hypothetical protein E3D38_11840 [Burkholderia cepacia]TEV02190.1 hypothetical protein E3D40_13575 [Burkholderia cepacia]